MNRCAHRCWRRRWALHEREPKDCPTTRGRRSIRAARGADARYPDHPPGRWRAGQTNRGGDRILGEEVPRFCREGLSYRSIRSSQATTACRTSSAASPNRSSAASALPSRGQRWRSGWRLPQLSLIRSFCRIPVSAVISKRAQRIAKLLDRELLLHAHGWPTTRSTRWCRGHSNPYIEAA